VGSMYMNTPAWRASARFVEVTTMSVYDKDSEMAEGGEWAGSLSPRQGFTSSGQGGN
jgi:hypothetical protein